MVYTARLLHALLCLFIKPNLFIILANRSTRWGFIFVFSFLFEGRFEKANPSPTTRWPDCYQGRLWMRAPLLTLLLPKSCRERERQRETSSRKRKHLKKHLIATRMPYVQLLWTPSTMWLSFTKYRVRLRRRVRFWRGARVVTGMTLKTLYTKTNSLLMCFGVSFHKQCIVHLTSSFEASVHQLQWNSCPLEGFCLDFVHA